MSEAAAIIAEIEAPAPAAPTAPVEGAPPPPEPSKSFTAVARREKGLQRQREELKSKEAAIAAREAQISARIAEIEGKFGSRPENPLKALERFGWSYKDATEFALNDSQPTAEQIARATQEEVSALKREQLEREEKRLAAEAERAAAQADEVITEFKSEIVDFVKTKPDDYELIALHNAHDLVYDVCAAYFEKNKRVLSIQDAANAVEKRLDKLAEKILSSRKIKARLPTAPSADPQQPADAGQVQAQQRRTLNNGMTPNSPTLMSSKSIEDDRMRRAMAALG
jgi:hypothetical protein